MKICGFVRVSFLWFSLLLVSNTAEAANPLCSLDEFYKRAQQFYSLGQLANARGELVTATQSEHGQTSAKHHLQLAKVAYEQLDIQTAGESIDTYFDLMAKGLANDINEKLLTFAYRFREEVGSIVLAGDKDGTPLATTISVKNSDDKESLASRFVTKIDGKLLGRVGKKTYLPVSQYVLGQATIEVKPLSQEVVEADQIGPLTHLKSFGQDVLESLVRNPPFEEILPSNHSSCVTQPRLARANRGESQASNAGLSSAVQSTSWFAKNAIWLVPVSVVVVAGVTTAAVVVATQEDEQEYNWVVGP